MPPRVLILAEYGILNGGERSLLAALDSMSGNWDFEAAAPLDSPLQAALAQRGIPVHPLELTDATGQRLSQDQRRQRLRDLLVQRQPQLVHANSLSMSRLVGPVVAALGIPSVGYLRDILKLSRAAIRDLNANSALVAVSRATADFHVTQGLDRHRVHVIYNGVNLEQFRPLPPGERQQLRRQRWGLAEGDPVLLFVGQLGMRKGIDWLVPMMDALRPRYPGLRLWIIGTRNSGKPEAVEYLSQIQQAVAARGWQESVSWLGRRSDVQQWMQAADLLVHPARQEPLGRVLLEASASGLPVVTTAVGGSPEIFPDPELAKCLVPADDCSEFVQRVDWLLGAVDLRTSLAQNLREAACRCWDARQTAHGLQRLYRELLETA